MLARPMIPKTPTYNTYRGGFHALAAFPALNEPLCPPPYSCLNNFGYNSRSRLDHAIPSLHRLPNYLFLLESTSRARDLPLESSAVVKRNETRLFAARYRPNNSFKREFREFPLSYNSPLP